MKPDDFAAANQFIEQLKSRVMSEQLPGTPPPSDPPRYNVTHVTINRARGCTFVFGDSQFPEMTPGTEPPNLKPADSNGKRP